MTATPISRIYDVLVDGRSQGTAYYQFKVWHWVQWSRVHDVFPTKDVMLHTISRLNDAAQVRLHNTKRRRP